MIDHDYHAHDSDADKALFRGLDTGSQRDRSVITVSNPFGPNYLLRYVDEDVFGRPADVMYALHNWPGSSAWWKTLLAARDNRRHLRVSRTLKPGKNRHLLMRTRGV